MSSFPPRVMTSWQRPRRGVRDVLSEKPMAETLDEARDSSHARKPPGGCTPCAKSALSRGCPTDRAVCPRAVRLAKSRGVHADFFVAPHFGGFREEMDHVLLLDMAIHTFDAARYMTGDGRRRLLPGMGARPFLVPAGARRPPFST